MYFSFSEILDPYGIMRRRGIAASRERTPGTATGLSWIPGLICILGINAVVDSREVARNMNILVQLRFQDFQDGG